VPIPPKRQRATYFQRTCARLFCVTDPNQPPVPPGWYPDPWNLGGTPEGNQRWWDGTAWTGHVPPPVAAASIGAAPSAAIPTSALPGWSGTAAGPISSPTDAIKREATAAKWLTVLGIAQAAINGVAAVLIVSLVRKFIDSVRTANEYSGTFQSPNGSSPFGGSGSFRLPPGLLLIGFAGWGYLGVRIWWTYRVCTNGKLAGLIPKYDPGLSAASWILPIIKFWFPYVGVRDSVRLDQRPSKMGLWWTSVILTPFISLGIGAALCATIGWTVGFPVAFVVGLLHVWIERIVSQQLLTAHRTLLGQ
jgi:Protein of unknown function (DUF2510)